MAPMMEFALLIFSLICISNFNLLSMMTPMSFSCVDISSSLLLSLYGVLLLFFVEMCMDLHLSGWNLSKDVFVQSNMELRSSCSFIVSSCACIGLNTFVSSANR